MPSIISLRVPASLHYRDMASRVMAGACKIADGDDRALSHEMVSVVGEAFNNVAIHGSQDRGDVDVTLEITIDDDRLVVRVLDNGASYAIDQVPTPDLGELPESGMGLFIMRAFTDELRYAPGNPNVLTLIKNYRGKKRST